VGAEYANTRHNIGFMIADELARTLGAKFDVDKLAFVANASYRGRNVTIIKPTTYMNLSGKALSYWMQKEKIQQQNVIVLVDDLAIPFGAIRLKQRGSHGGHNGHKSIQECLGHDNYARLRFGIGSDYPKGRQVDYVLGEWTAGEQKDLPARVEKAVEAVKCFIFEGIDRTMAMHNGN